MAVAYSKLLSTRIDVAAEGDGALLSESSTSDCQEASGRTLSWYALRIRPRYEKLAAMTLEHKGYESFLPLYKCRRRRPDRFRNVHLPLFPGYLFCHFDVTIRLPILTTPGVMHVVGLGQIPVPVKTDEIDAIRRLVNSPLGPQPWPFIEAGQRVLIQEGPLQGMEGTLLTVKNSHRLVISVALLQRSVAVEIDRSWAVSIPVKR